MSILFKECIEALSDQVTVLSPPESIALWEKFSLIFPKDWSCINWEKINTTIVVTSSDQIISSLEKLLLVPLDPSIYILWNNGSVPVIKTNLKAAASTIDDITCVGLDTWFWNPTQQYIVEFYHLYDNITSGIVEMG